MTYKLLENDNESYKRFLMTNKHHQRSYKNIYSLAIKQH